MRQRDYFIPKMFYRLMIPSVISSFGFALADMADALVVGQKLGEVGLAAISLCLPLFMLINIFMDGLGIGGSVLFSQKLGEGDVDGARRCFNRTWTAVLVLGCMIGIIVNLFDAPCLELLGTQKNDGSVYYACRDYVKIVAAGAPLLMLNVVFANFLRNDNNAALASAGFLTGNAVDIVLNIVLVIFCDLGTRGAALSTVIGSAVAIAIYAPGIIGKKADVIQIEKFAVDMKETIYCFKTGFATSVRHLLQLVFFLIINRLLMSKSGESGVAVFDIVYNVSFFAVYLCNGIAEAAQPLVSTFTGENNEGDCRYILRLSKIWAVCLGAVVAALVAANAERISLFFGIPASLVSDSAAAVRIYCIGFAPLGLNIINEKYYQSKNLFWPSFLIVVMREFAILIPCAVAFSWTGVLAIWFLYPVTEIAAYLIFKLIRRRVVTERGMLGSDRIFRITLTEAGDIGNVMQRCGEFCKRFGADAKCEFAVTLVTEEICMSIMRNAMKDVSDGKIRITVLALENGDFAVNFLDNAVEFNPFSFVTGKITAESEFNIDEISMTMIKNKTKKMTYHKCGGFNSLAVYI